MYMDYPVTAVYFSPTDTSRRGACTIAGTLGSDYSELDLTRGPAEALFGRNEIVVFGAPVYGGRLFNGFVERLAGVRGSQTPCIVTVTYGNRDYDDALLELCDLAAAQGFVPVAAAALVGQHTYGSIQVGRPNDDDLAEDAAFAAKVAEKLEKGDYTTPAVPGKRPYKEGGSGGKFRPLTGEACTDCGLCAMECPMQAIGPDHRTIDNDRCIACFRCIRNCPVGAKHMNVPAYNDFAAMFSEKLKAPKANAYFL